MRYVILGTAGHIDHGKSSLVKAISGTDPDRLKEEKERGITIDIGFAELPYPDDGLSVGIVDVPGHERLIKNMLAGAGGIDMVLMVIAADEGIMPQSREHLHICNLLKIKTGLVAITKSDLVEPDWLDLVMDEAAEFVKGTFLEGAPIVPMSSRTGEGIEDLKRAIKGIALEVQPKPAKGLFRLPVDRVFTLKGFGTVITGTAISGAVSTGDTVEILPSAIETKVRGMHSHGRQVGKAFAGQRVALNLQGIETYQLERGDTVVAAGRFIPVTALDARVELLADSPPLKNRSQVHFHLGTSETLARVILYDAEALEPGQTGYCQFRLSTPVVAQCGDRYVIRRLSPLQTMGGGEVLDSTPHRRRKRDGIEDLVFYGESTLAEKIAAKVRRASLDGMQIAMIEGWINAEVPEIKRSVDELKRVGVVSEFDGTLIHGEAIEVFRQSLLGMLNAFHKENPLRPGIAKEEVRARLHVPQRIFASLLERVPEAVADKDILRLKRFSAAVSDEDKDKVMEILRARGFQPPTVQELARELSRSERQVSDMLRLMQQGGGAVRVNDSMFIASEVYDDMIARLRDHFVRNPEMTVAEFRDLLGTTRKYALPILEYLDTNRVTLRVGEARKLMIK